MIIRNRTTKTLEAFPLNNRGCAVPPDRDKKGQSEDRVAVSLVV